MLQYEGSVVHLKLLLVGVLHNDGNILTRVFVKLISLPCTLSSNQKPGFPAMLCDWMKNAQQGNNSWNGPFAIAVHLYIQSFKRATVRRIYHKKSSLLVSS